MHVLIQGDYLSTCISHQSRNFAAVNQNSLSIMKPLLFCEIWCSLKMGIAPKAYLHNKRLNCISILSDFHLYLGFPSIKGSMYS